jgi:hypothetical protein
LFEEQLGLAGVNRNPHYHPPESCVSTPQPPNASETRRYPCCISWHNLSYPMSGSDPVSGLWVIGSRKSSDDRKLSMYVSHTRAADQSGKGLPASPTNDLRPLISVTRRPSQRECRVKQTERIPRHTAVLNDLPTEVGSRSSCDPASSTLTPASQRRQECRSCSCARGPYQQPLLRFRGRGCRRLVWAGRDWHHPGCNDLSVCGRGYNLEGVGIAGTASMPMH